MSHSVALKVPEKISGIIAMSGRILQEVRKTVKPSAAHKHLFVRIIHGTRDTKLSVQHAHTARNFLEGFPLDLAYREYNMAHEMSHDSFEDSSRWLASRI